MGRFIGVDAGKTPSICVLNNRGQIVDNVLIKESKSFPHLATRDYMRSLNLVEDDVVTIELPHSVYGSSAKSNFVFGYSVGASVQAVQCCTDNYFLVSPRDWQRLIIKDCDVVKKSNGKNDTKATALNCAKRILGEAWSDDIFFPTKRSRVVNHNMVDSFLIGFSGLNPIE